MATVPDITAVVLGAGASRRMGSNKLLYRLAGKPIVRHTVEAALSSRVAQVIVVTRNNRDDVSASLLGLNISLVDNPTISAGLSQSLKCGIRKVPPHSVGAVILLGDMPYVRAEHINALIAAWAPGRICVPVFRGRRGNPVLWDRSFFPAILGLAGDAGAKSLMSIHATATYEVPSPDQAILIDIDTPGDLPDE